MATRKLFDDFDGQGQKLDGALVDVEALEAEHARGIGQSPGLGASVKGGDPVHVHVAVKVQVNVNVNVSADVGRAFSLASARENVLKSRLERFEQYVMERRLAADALSPAVVDGFLAERRVNVCANSLGPICAALRTFLRYLFREGIIRRDLSLVVDGPRTYSLSEIPRSISPTDVERTLAAVERRSIVGRRDYAMLMLLVVYGLRAREVAALTVDDVDWRASVLHVRGRKAGHAAAFPLAPEVGEALLAYLRQGRPETVNRRIFFCHTAPRAPVTHQIVSSRARFYLRNAGVTVLRPGSHTLRHSCAQRLVDAEFSLKVIGDFLGHRHAASTRIYSKVAIEALREVALGEGEAIL